MNHQEIFDTVLDHLAQQKRPAFREKDEGLQCAYRGVGGKSVRLVY